MRYMKSFRINIYATKNIHTLEMETKTQKRKHQDDYENFIDTNFERIVDAFAKNGFEVRNREDIDTYPRWEKRNHQVQMGSFATQVLDTKPTPQVIYSRGGLPAICEITGKTKIRTFKKNYSLFHISQTRKHAPVKTYKIPTT